MTFSVKISNNRRVTRPQWRDAAESWVAQVEPLGESALRATAPVSQGKNGGMLRKSIRGGHAISAASAVITYVAVDYVRFVIDGTVAHDIRPRNKRALFWEGAEHPVGLVHHPGTKPNDFVERALAPLEPEVKAAMKRAIAVLLDT